jgi:predicted nucleic acid-binding protein
MKVLVDTTIWSLVLRRKDPTGNEPTLSGRIAVIGPIRQELLSGVKDRAVFERLREYLRVFPDMEITSDDYETAAVFYNACRAKGIQGSNTDFLICAVAAHHALPIFTADADFRHFAAILPITLQEPDR